MSRNARPLKLPKLIQELSRARNVSPQVGVGFGGGGAEGDPGRDAGLAYSFDTSTSMADPGSGDVRFNSGTIASVTAIAISDTDDEGNDQDGFLDTWDDSTSTVKGLLVISTADGQVIVFEVTAISDQGTWHQATVVHRSGTLPSNDEALSVLFVRTGDKGSPVDYLCYQDQKAANTAGGGFTSGAWRTRDLNTEVADSGGHGSVASNQITLAAGTYRVRGSAPAFYVGQHKTRLRNVTDGVTLALGTSEYTNPGASTGYDQTRSILIGRFTLAGSKVLEVQHQCNSTRATDGFGQASNFGESEVYAEIEFWKE